MMKKACYNLIPWLSKADFALLSISDSKLISIVLSSNTCKQNETDGNRHVESMNDFCIHLAENQVSGRSPPPTPQSTEVLFSVETKWWEHH